MALTKWFLVVVAIVGLLLFLYGANFYDYVVGWVGVVFFVAAVVAALVLYVRRELAKRTVQKP